MLSVRTSNADPQTLAAAVTREIHSLDKDLPVTQVSTFDQILSREASPKRFNAGLFSIFAALALLLAATGVYGVTSYTVAERTHEIGIRMALGAQQADVLKLFIREGMTVVLLGVLIGLGSAVALTRLLASLLFGVSATDATSFGLAAGGLLLVALFACWIPRVARRKSIRWWR